MRQFRTTPAAKIGGEPTLVPSDSIWSGLLLSGIEQTVTVPTGATVAIFGYTGDTWVNYDTTAAVPTGTISQAGGELNPDERYVGETTVLHIIADSIVKFDVKFYGQ